VSPQPERTGHRGRPREGLTLVKTKAVLNVHPESPCKICRTHASLANRNAARRRRLDVRTIKLDGFRAIAFKSAGVVHLRSRNNNNFESKYPAIAKALQMMPDETVIDGEIVAFD